MKKLLTILSFFMLVSTFAQEIKKPATPDFSSFGRRKAPILITNDLSGDVDGIFALVHQLLCTSSEIKGIVGTHLGNQRAWTTNGQNTSVLDQAIARAHEVMGLLDMKDQIKESVKDERFDQIMLLQQDITP